MTRQEFKAALKAAPRVFVEVPCTGNPDSVAAWRADDAQTFEVSKAQAARVLLHPDQTGDIIAVVHQETGDLYIG
jgi:hypothetical protein